MSSSDRNPLLNTIVVSETSSSPETSTMSENSSSYNYAFKIFATSMHTLSYLLIGASVFVLLWFCLKSTPISTFQLHILLTVIGYQLLMSYGILSLNNYAVWATPMTVLHRRRTHWVLQLIGSGLAITGSVLMIRSKAVNFTSVHGKLALAALIATCISLINGVMTHYSIFISRYIPSKVFKNNHLLLGTAAFAFSSVCLGFGYNKRSFREWASDELSYVMIAMTSTYTVIVISKPCYTLWRTLTKAIKLKIF